MTLNLNNPPARQYVRPAEQLWFEQRRRDLRARYVGNDRDGYEVGSVLRSLWRATTWQKVVGGAIVLAGLYGLLVVLP